MTTDIKAQKVLIILNDPPYGTERSYNGLRLATTLGKRDETDLKVFLIGDAVSCAKRGQQTPNGYYNLERMLKVLSHQKVSCGACGSCLDARGFGVQDLAEPVQRSSLEELALWTGWADKVLVF